MKRLRHALFAFLLLLAQSGALTHAVEHLRIDADTPASHTCALCIAAQGLDAPLASTTPAITVSAACFPLPAGVIDHVFAPSAVTARARAPPSA